MQLVQEKPTKECSILNFFNNRVDASEVASMNPSKKIDDIQIDDFSPFELLLIQESNLGLRLTQNLDEGSKPGRGDAIPLSHLAGVKDVIEFVTLANQPELNRRRMQAIYNEYRDLGSKDINCLPRLILYYAAKHKISDAEQCLNDASVDYYFIWQLWWIESEAKKLVDYYNKYGNVCTLAYVVDFLPCLSQELAHHFNEKLKLRLTINYYSYSCEQNVYLLLSDEKGTFKLGYDWNSYPLGKIGSTDLSHCKVLDQKHFDVKGADICKEKELARDVFERIRKIVSDNLDKLYQNQCARIMEQSANPQMTGELEIRACQMTRIVSDLKANKQLSAQESYNLIYEIRCLLDTPSKYQKFLSEVNSCKMIAGGLLFAYVMLLVGYAAQILTFNYAGHAWIDLANNQLNLIEASEQLARAASINHSNRM